MILALIAALTQNHVIGANGGIPWRIPEDATWFRQKTTGHPVLMGRKTYDSMGMPLKNRTNIVVTRNRDFAPDDVLVANTIEAGISMAEGTPGSEELFVIGGQTIYEETLKLADRLYLTHLDVELTGDTFFPEFNRDDWNIVYEGTRPPVATFPHTYTFVIYERKEAKITAVTLQADSTESD